MYTRALFVLLSELDKTVRRLTLTLARISRVKEILHHLLPPGWDGNLSFQETIAGLLFGGSLFLTGQKFNGLLLPGLDSPSACFCYTEDALPGCAVGAPATSTAQTDWVTMNKPPWFVDRSKFSIIQKKY